MLALRQPLAPRRGAPAASACSAAGRGGGSSRLTCRAALPARAAVARAAAPRAAASLPAPERTPSSPLSSLSASRLSAAALALCAAKGGGDGGDSRAAGAKPLLQAPAPPRPTVTNVNVVIAGSHQYLGRPELAPASAAGGAAPAPATAKCVASAVHQAFLDDPDAWASVMEPLEVPGACRQLIYKFQDTPGLHCTVDYARHLACLLLFMLRQQTKDKEMLQQSARAGNLRHSATVLLYLLPPYGPLPKLDLVMMCALSERVPLLPVIVMPDAATAASKEEAAACQASAAAMLANPSLAGLDLPPAKLFSFSDGRTLPLLLSPANGSGVTEELIRLLSDQELYGMLDQAWSCFDAFVGSDAEVGDDLVEWSLSTAGVKALNKDLQDARQLLAKAQDAKEQVNKVLTAEREKTAEKAEQLARVQEEFKQLYTSSSFWLSSHAYPSLHKVVFGDECQ